MTDDVASRRAVRVSLVEAWQARLRLVDWQVRVSPLPPAEGDMRSSVDQDANLHVAVIRFDPLLPADQDERQVLHELLHVRLLELEDAFRQVVDDDATARTWFERAEERIVEALVDALLPDQPRREYRGDPVWVVR